MEALPSATEAGREWGKKSQGMVLLADQTRMPGKEGDPRLTRGLSNPGARHRKAESGAHSSESVRNGA